ncbi:uncharacterized protein LOC128651511 isoform X1 [Bombina bombina]|uniref:uncharacterized protein LOC128651511 isoform X1 n=1 Tax=Bombina bombina TaxID=8345 RepID=UPI00235ACFB7|nr:uncharacterized protein LOC128651511 isoform X1 [Bombina bombina]
MAQFDALLEQLKVEAVKRGPTWLEEKLRPLLVPDIGERADKEAASPRPVRLSRPPVRLDPDSEGSNGGRRRSSPSPGVKSTMKKRTGSSSGSRHVEAEIRHPAIPSSSSVSIAEQVRVSEKEGDYLPKGKMANLGQKEASKGKRQVNKGDGSLRPSLASVSNEQVSSVRSVGVLERQTGEDSRESGVPGLSVLSQVVEAQVHKVSKTAQVFRPSSSFEEQSYRVLDERVKGVEVSENQPDAEVCTGSEELTLYLDSSEEDFIPTSPRMVGSLRQFKPAVRASGDLILRGELRNLREGNADVVKNVSVSNNVYLLEGNEIGSRPVNPLGFLVVGNDGLSGEAYGLQESWTDNIRLDIEDGVPMAGRPNSRGEEAGAERSQQEMAITETRTPGFQNREKVTAASQVDQSTAAQDFGSVEPFSGACSSGRCSRNEFPGSIMEAWGGGLAELIKNSLAPGVRIVWVMGHSFIYWANAEASKKMGGLQLGCPVGQWEVKWFGIRRMCWELLFPVFVEYSKVFHHPDVLVLHLGGNDLGIIPQKELVRRIKRDLGNIKDLYPEIKIIWSQITPRLVWRSAWDYDKLERSRKK